MLLKRLLLCALLVTAAHCISSKTDYSCAHDGLATSEGKCECAKSAAGKYLYSGSKCTTSVCLNSGVVQSDMMDDNNQRCECPPGFLGTHCEPVQCIPGELQSFDQISHGRDVSVIITYDTKFQEQIKNKDKTDNLPKVICDAISEADGVTSDSKIHFWLMETDVQIDKGDNCEEEVRNTIQFCDAVGKGYSCEGNLTTSYIMDALETMGEDSRLIILANEGIVDVDSADKVEAIRKKAISLRTQIHSIVLSPRTPNPNKIYFEDPGYKLLRQLSESTLGFFITPFDASGGQMIGSDGMATILQKMMPVFFDYVVLDRISTTTTSCDQSIDFTVFRTRDQDNPPPFWLTVTSNGAAYAQYTTQWIPSGAPNSTIDAGFFKAYTMNADYGTVYTFLPYSKMGSKCVPTTVMVLAKSTHQARFAITNRDEIDASSPFAISGGAAVNTLVGHFIAPYHDDHLQSLYIDDNSNANFKIALDDTPTPRDNCQYNGKFATVSCDEGENTLIRVRDRDSGAAVTIQSLYCAANEDSAVHSMESNLPDGEDFNLLPVDGCSASNIVAKMDSRSLVLAAHATDKIYELFDGSRTSAIKYLNDLAASGHYSSYILNIFTNASVSHAQDADDYPDFKSKLMYEWNVENGAGKRDCDCDAVHPFDGLVPLTEIIGSTVKTLQPNSDILYIVDQKFWTDEDPKEVDSIVRQFQQKMYNRRQRLIVLILGCANADFADSNNLKLWNKIATKTGGFAVYFDLPANLNKFLASYVNWVKGEPAATFDNKEYPSPLFFSQQPITSTPFQAVAGKTYTILTNTLPIISEVSVNGGESTLTADATYGNSFAVYSYTPEASGPVTITASPDFYFFYASVRVLDMDDDNQATIGFSDSTCLDIAAPALNPKTAPQYPTAVTVAEATVTMTLADYTGTAFRSSEITEATAATTYIMTDYNWRCNDKDNMFYITADIVTATSTFSRVLTTQCFGGDGGDPSDKCTNGYATDKDLPCICPHDYTGDVCDVPVCQNGGVVTPSLECDCSETGGYSGQFCQIYDQCAGQTKVSPTYRTIATTIVFLVEQEARVLAKIEKLAAITFEDARSAQYIVVEYDEHQYKVRISTTDKDLVLAELTAIKPHPHDGDSDPTAPNNGTIPAIKAALQAQTTPSSHIFWFATDDYVEDDFMSELFEPIASNRVTISAFFNTPSDSDTMTTLHPITLAGGSIFYSGDETTSAAAHDNDYKTIFNSYILPLLKFGVGFELRLNTIDISYGCDVKRTINLDASVTTLVVAADDSETEKITLRLTPSTDPVDGITEVAIPGGRLFTGTFVAGEYAVEVPGYACNKVDSGGETIDGKNGTTVISALNFNQVSYGFYVDDASDAIMDTPMMGNNVLATYWMAESVDRDPAPTAVITPLTLDGEGDPVEIYATIRDACSYSLSVPITCSEDLPAYGVKVTNYIYPKGGVIGVKVDKYIPVLCYGSHSCDHGEETEHGCKCDAFWGGPYCDVYSCKNGEEQDDKCVCNTGWSGDNCDVFTKPIDREGKGYLLIQDVCGTDENLKDSAQGVLTSYYALLKSPPDSVFLGTNNADIDIVKITSAADLTTALAKNRGDTSTCTATLGNVLDNFYALLLKPILMMNLADASIGQVQIAHLTSVGIDSNTGSKWKGQTDFLLTMSTVGITNKNEDFANAASFANVPGTFSQTYDPEEALLDLYSDLGAEVAPKIPSTDNLHHCVTDLQAVIVFHTDISSVTNSMSFRQKAQDVINSVTKYFTTAKAIDNDSVTCEYSKEQEANVTLFSGSIYCDTAGIGIPNQCISNMDKYPESITKAEYKQGELVTMASVISYYTKWYNLAKPQMMDCHCFDYQNADTTNIIIWTPLSPTSMDNIDDVSFAGFEGVNFHHIVMPFGFDYSKSPLWRKLVPDQRNWVEGGDASDAKYPVNQIIRDIWTIVCRLSGRIEESETAEPFAYTTRKPNSPGEASQDDQSVTDDPNIAPGDDQS